MKIRFRKKRLPIWLGLLIALGSLIIALLFAILIVRSWLDHRLGFEAKKPKIELVTPPGKFA